MKTTQSNRDKEVVDGVTYNVATAKVVAVHGSPQWIHQKLCKTKTARWFTQYGKDTFVYGVHPLTVLEAVAWLHSHEFAGLVEDHFPGLSAYAESRFGRPSRRSARSASHA